MKIVVQNNATLESIKLLAELKENKVRFAHWKGNSHLLQSLEGKTDIDPQKAPSLVFNLSNG